MHGSPTKKMEPTIQEEAESETGSHQNVNGVISDVGPPGQERHNGDR